MLALTVCKAYTLKSLPLVKKKSGWSAAALSRVRVYSAALNWLLTRSG
jgi:hypothetical protein